MLKKSDNSPSAGGPVREDLLGGGGAGTAQIMSMGNRWEDHYARRARQEKWLARSVYKLEEIDRKFGLLKPGQRLLDLGCYPGSWSQYCIRRVGPEGDVVGLDLKAPETFRAGNFRFIRADVLDLDIRWLFAEVGPRDAVISDMAPQTTGISVSDVSRSLELAGKALAIAEALLKPNGKFLCKVFEGEGIGPFRKQISSRFKRLQIFRPAAVRKASREVYLLGLGLVKGKPQNIEYRMSNVEGNASGD